MAIRWLTLFLDRPASDYDLAEIFWADVTGSQLSARRGPGGEFVTLLPPAGDAYLRLQRVQEGAGGTHLDLHLDQNQESLSAAADRAVALGARLRHQEAGLRVLDSPGGYGFCLVDWDGEATTPEPLGLDSGGASRLDQLCLDVPAERFEAECSFWSTLTGWEQRSGSRAEFVVLERPDGMPLRVMLQRLGSAEPNQPVRGHLDLAAVDRLALTERHRRAGAQPGDRFPHWTTMTDPSGRVYCLTDRDPVTGRLPEPDLG